VLSQKEQEAATQIARDVVENGRVETNGDALNIESLRVEVSFEAGERGYDAATAEEMAQYAATNI
jgi:hypothetical protein